MYLLLISAQGDSVAKTAILDLEDFIHFTFTFPIIPLKFLEKFKFWKSQNQTYAGVNLVTWTLNLKTTLTATL